MPALLQKLPLRDAASRHLLKHPDGSPLYPGGSPVSDSAAAKRSEVLKSWPGNRTALAAWLKKQNAFAPLHPAQSSNLAAAGRPDSLFLLTGQQPSLLGGPALWYCKAMTCATMARACAQRLGRPVIPIFWAAGDDSDLAECAAVEWLEPGAESPGFTLDFPDAQAAIPMSLRRLPDAGLADLFRIPRALWDKETLSLAETSYRRDDTVTGAFLRLAQGLLASEGILFVDGFSAAEQAQPFMIRLAREARSFQRALGEGTRRLADVLSLPPQVTPRGGVLPLFRLENGQRSRLYASDGIGREGESFRIYSQGNESRDLTPELGDALLLPTALSRPLMAETLFPVLGHVLGPAELRYFAQIADAFPALGLSFPPVHPRQQAIVCSREDWKRLSALGLGPEDLPDLSPTRLRALLAARLWEGSPAAAEFPEDAFRALAVELRDYRDRFFPASGEMDAAGRRLEKVFGRFRDAARQALFARRGAETYASFRPLLRWLGNGSQDRHVNLLSLRNALGAKGFAAWTELLREESPGIAVTVFGKEA